MSNKLKTHATIGCCGIDCSLCPKFYTKGNSACPGCGGEDFKEKHPSCGFLTCCAIKSGLEVCSFCKEYPCNRFNSEKDGYDSFVTHQKLFYNLNSIKSNGIDQFLEQQKVRTSILTTFLANYDDGRSKSLLCLSCALLPIDQLLEIATQVETFALNSDIKAKNSLLKDLLTAKAAELEIKLNLNKKQ